MARMRFVLWLSALLVFSLPCFAAEERDYYQPINGTKLHFHVSTVDPAKPYILYLNGGPGDTPAFERAMLQLVNLNLNMIYLDQRSCGKSERKVDPTTFTEENLVKDIDGVLDYLGLEKIVLLGHSFGATYATAYAANRPDRVVALFYMDGPVDFRSSPLNFYQYATEYGAQLLEILSRLTSHTRPAQDDAANLNRFCGFMALYQDHSAKIREAARDCRDHTTLMATESALSLTSEVENDLAAVQEAWKEGPWKAWNTRGIRRKYGMYRHSYLKSDFEKEAARLALQFYSPEETEESAVMADGLSASGFWDNNSVLMGRITALKPEFHYFVGKFDRIFFSPELADWVRQKHGASHVTVFEKSGHSPIFEEPEAFREGLTRAYQNLKAMQ